VRVWDSGIVRASVFAAVLCGGYWALTAPPHEPLENLGRAAALAGPAPDGRHVALSDYAGQVVLVAFWATWCSPCRKELPDLIDLQRWKSSDFTILGVSVDQDPAVAGRFASEAGINYPIVVKPGPPAPEGWSVPDLPTAYLVGRDGTVLRRYAGILNVRAVRADIKDALAR